MIFKITGGDILLAKTEAIVNPVNCVGVMGKGLAKAFKTKYPEMFKQYKARCTDSMHGQVFVYTINIKTVEQFPKYIVCLPTKYHWREGSNIDLIKLGLWTLRQNIYSLGIRSIALPMLGCGLGGLPSKVIMPLMEKELAGIPTKVFIYIDYSKGKEGGFLLW